MTDISVLANRVLPLIDLTDLASDSNDASVAQLCKRAVGPHGTTAAVCIWPEFVPLAAKILASEQVHIATVVNFPDGGADIASVTQIAAEAIERGADEIDLVLPYHAFLAGDTDVVVTMLDATRVVVPRWASLKVILESGSYPDLDSIRLAARLAIECGADFVKTSTGKSPISATLAATVMILDAVRGSDRAVGFKPSGGIRTVEDAGRYLAIADEMLGAHWATPETFRFGASGLLDDVENTIARHLR